VSAAKGGELSAKALPLTKHATDVETKPMVKQMSFKSPSPANSVGAQSNSNL
jgi:hypothetical protein